MKIPIRTDRSYLISACVIILLVLGLFALYSTSYKGHSFFNNRYVQYQIKWIVIGLISAGIIFLINYKRLLEISYLAYLINIILLILVIFLGQSKLGASRWLSLLGINFQPSELMKLIIILTLSRYLSSYKYEETGLKTVAYSFAIAIFPILLIIQQPDLGTALIFIPIFFVMLYIWSGRLKYILVTLLGGIIFSPILWHFLKDYQKERLLVFINPNIDPLGAGYTIIQSKIAIGSGGIFGKGWLEGTQNQLNFLPETHTDFIFSSIGEEWGLIGALIIIFLYFVIIWQGFNIAQEASVSEGKLLAAGISMLLVLHVVINICMTIGLMPVVGLPLPFISYGGSHTVTFLIMMAVLLSVKYQKL